MGCRYTESALQEIFCDAMELFTECLETDICTENTALAFFTPDNGKEVYESFCRRYFPKYLEENYLQEGYFESIAAQAFVDGAQNGILFRGDIDLPASEAFYIFLHEISHLFCTRNEINGDNFFQKYCMGSGEEDGMINAGYAIWREAIADIMASSVVSEAPTARLSFLKREVTSLYKSLSVSNPDSKKCMSLILAYIMCAAEVAGTEDWEQAERAIRKAFSFPSTMMFILKLVFQNLHQQPFWSITPEFIFMLGQAYLTLLSLLTFEDYCRY